MLAYPMQEMCMTLQHTLWGVLLRSLSCKLLAINSISSFQLSRKSEQVF